MMILTNGQSRPSFDMPMRVDFNVHDHGSIVLLQPITKAAAAWSDEHLPDDAMMFGTAFAVEPRFVADILRGAIADGLVVRMSP